MTGRRAPRAARGLALGALLLGAPAALGAGWCEVPFRTVAEEAHSVVLARYDTGSRPPLRVVEPLLGPGAAPSPAVGHLLAEHAPRDGDLFVVALSADGLPVAGGVGSCDAIAVLPLRRGRLAAGSRDAYDGGRGAMSLEELRADLAGIRPAALRRSSSGAAPP